MLNSSTIHRSSGTISSDTSKSKKTKTENKFIENLTRNLLQNVELTNDIFNRLSLQSNFDLNVTTYETGDGNNFNLGYWDMQTHTITQELNHYEYEEVVAKQITLIKSALLSGSIDILCLTNVDPIFFNHKNHLLDVLNAHGHGVNDIHISYNLNPTGSYNVIVSKNNKVTQPHDSSRLNTQYLNNLMVDNYYHITQLWINNTPINIVLLSVNTPIDKYKLIHDILDNPLKNTILLGNSGSDLNHSAITTIANFCCSKETQEPSMNLLKFNMTFKHDGGNKTISSVLQASSFEVKHTKSYSSNTTFCETPTVNSFKPIETNVVEADHLICQLKNEPKIQHSENEDESKSTLSDEDTLSAQIYFLKYKPSDGSQPQLSLSARLNLSERRLSDHLSVSRALNLNNTQLRITTWNIHGLAFKSVPEYVASKIYKEQIMHIVRILKDSDILCLQEVPELFFANDTEKLSEALKAAGLESQFIIRYGKTEDKACYNVTIIKQTEKIETIDNLSHMDSTTTIFDTLKTKNNVANTGRTLSSLVRIGNENYMIYNVHCAWGISFESLREALSQAGNKGDARIIIAGDVNNNMRRFRFPPPENGTLYYNGEECVKRSALITAKSNLNYNPRNLRSPSLIYIT